MRQAPVPITRMMIRQAIIHFIPLADSPGQVVDSDRFTHVSVIKPGSTPARVPGEDIRDNLARLG